MHEQEIEHYLAGLGQWYNTKSIGSNSTTGRLNENASVSTNDDPDVCWATFCAASVEWLCERYGIACPSWVENPIYALPEPWYDSPAAHKRQVRERLRSQTPAPFARRNVYSGDRMFANKYEFAANYQGHTAAHS